MDGGDRFHVRVPACLLANYADNPPSSHRRIEKEQESQVTLRRLFIFSLPFLR